MRERLHKKRKQEGHKLRRKHVAEMQMQACLSKLSLREVTQSPPSLPAQHPQQRRQHRRPLRHPRRRLRPSPATLAELATATDGVGEQRLIGSGGYGRVYTQDALSSLRPEVLPLWLRHKAVAVKRAKSGVHDIADLQREVSVLQQCSQPHALPFAPLLSGARGAAVPCLAFPLMRGGSLPDRLWPKEADPEHLRRPPPSVRRRAL